MYLSKNGVLSPCAHSIICSAMSLRKAFLRPRTMTAAKVGLVFFRLRALRFCTKPHASTTSMTFLRVSSLTSGRPLSTRETVLTATPALRATSRIV